jgi:hypothetical protein
MIDWVTAKITCTHNPEVLSSGRSIRTKIIDGVELGIRNLQPFGRFWLS